MKIKNIVIGAIAPILGLTAVPNIVFAQSIAQYNSGCTVQIVGRERGSRVNLRSGAGTEFSSPSYLLVGQSVTMLDNARGQRISREDSQGSTWYFVEYEPSGTRGWIREDFIAPQCNEAL
jgi:hypothetical protein